MTNTRRPGQPPAGQEGTTVGQLVAIAGAVMVAIGIALILMNKLEVIDDPAATTSTQGVIGWVLAGVGIVAALAGGVLLVRERNAKPLPKPRDTGGRRDR